MANPFGWQQVQLKDTSIAGQAAIRTAQQSTQNIVNIAEDYQTKRGAIESRNFTQQGKLNTQEIALQSDEFATTESLAEAQEAGGKLNAAGFAEKYGLNFNQQAAQTSINDQYSELAQAEVAKIAVIGEDIDKIKEQGTGGLNVIRARLMANAKTPLQRKNAGIALDAQLAITQTAQNKTMIDSTLEDFGGGLGKDGDTLTHNNAVVRLRNLANRAGYNPQQIDNLVKEYNQAEIASNTLKGAQVQVHDGWIAENTEQSSMAISHATANAASANLTLQEAYTTFKQFDLSDSGLTTDEILQQVGAGSIEPEILDSINKYVNQLGGKITTGRKQAIVANIAGSKNYENIEASVVLELQKNNAGYGKAERLFKKAQLNTDNLNDTITKLRSEGASFKVKAFKNAKGDKSKPVSPTLDAYMDGLNRTVEEGRVDSENIGNGIAGNGQGDNSAKVPTVEQQEQQVADNAVVAQQDRATLQDEYSPIELGKLYDSANSIRDDDVLGPLVAGESTSADPYKRHGGFKQQDADIQEFLAANGRSGEFKQHPIPTARIAVKDYTDQTDVYRGLYKEASGGRPPSTAAGPLQIVGKNFSDALKAGIIFPDDNMGMETQVRVANWLIISNPAIRNYLKVSSQSINPNWSISKQKAALAEVEAAERAAIPALGGLWISLQGKEAESLHSLRAMAKRTRGVFSKNAVKQKKDITYPLLNALEPENLITFADSAYQLKKATNANLKRGTGS